MLSVLCSIWQRDNLAPGVEIRLQLQLTCSIYIALDCHRVEICSCHVKRANIRGVKSTVRTICCDAHMYNCHVLDNRYEKLRRNIKKTFNVLIDYDSHSYNTRGAGKFFDGWGKIRTKAPFFAKILWMIA